MKPVAGVKNPLAENRKQEKAGEKGGII